MTVYAGTSGFSYESWRGRFYPAGLPARRMLVHYAERLPAVEMNGSFYRTPPESTLTGWGQTVPAGFRFCFKAHRGLTYSAAAFPKLELAADLGARLRVVGDRLGPVLVQFPPTAAPDHGHLDALLEALGLPAAVEPRSEAWFGPALEAVLRRRAAALVVTDEEKWPVAPELETAPFSYFRLRRDYSEEELGGWARRLAAPAARGELHVFFKHEPEAPSRALRLLELLAA